MEMQRTNRQKQLDKDLRDLMARNGYSVLSNRLLSKGITGFTSDRTIGNVRSLFDAAERLIPIIADASYLAAFQQITKSL